MGSIIKFGEDVEGYSIPVLNEREIRAASGILFVFALMSLLMILFKGDFMLAKYFVIIFFSDFVVRVFVNPRFSPALIIGRLIVSRQTPEYVGAAQKKFAWKIGISLAGIMLVLMVFLNSYSIVTGLICLICLIFLFFESAFGICLGCLFYGWFYKEKAQYCPGEICDLKNKQAIQKTNAVQVAIVIGFAVYIVLVVVFLKTPMSARPENLWQILGLKA